MASKVVAAALCAAALASVASAQRVLVVDAANGPGTDFVTLASAISVADDGDVIVLRTGIYDPFVVTNTSLTIVADSGANVFVRETINVENLAANKRVLLRGLQVVSGDFSYGVTFENCAGPVWVEDCDFFGGGGNVVSGGLFVANCASILFSHCSASPTTGASTSRAGLFAIGSNVFAYDCTFTGGEGFDFPNGPSSGSPGVNLQDAIFFSSGNTLTGGNGGNGGIAGFFCTNGGDAGSGLELDGAGGSGAAILDQLATAGTAGLGGAGCIPGAPGLPVEVVTGTTLPLAGTARLVRTLSPVREGEQFGALFIGEPGDAVTVVLSPMQVQAVPLLALFGTAHIVPGLTAAAGVIPATGTLTASFTVPELGAGIESVQLHVQALFVDGVGAQRIGSPSAPLILDSSF